MNKKVEYPATQEDITNYKDNKKSLFFKTQDQVLNPVKLP